MSDARSRPCAEWERNRTRARCLRLAPLALAVLVLEACTVGPDYERPRDPDTGAFVRRPPRLQGPATGDTAHPDAQTLHYGSSVVAEWWLLFKSPTLDRTLDQAVSGNATLEAALATLAQARQAVIQARGARYPQVDASAGASRQRSAAIDGAAGLAGSTYSLYSAGSTVSYAADVFGLTARRVEQAEAQAENQRYQAAAAYLTLTGNAVITAVDIAAARAQIAAAEEIVQDSERNRALVEKKFASGKAPRTDLLTAETQLAADRTLLPPLRQQLSMARHALAVLVGKTPSEWSAPPFDLGDFTLPRDLPLSLPSQLVHRRPDILAAEAQLHAASAAIGVAQALRYPDITLSASLGNEALSAERLFGSGGVTNSLVAGLMAPLFHGGALTAQKEAAEAAYRAALALYRQTVLQAFQQVADTLRALEHDSELVEAERLAVETARATRDAQRIGFEAGKTTVLQLLDAERSYQQARLAHARARGQWYADSAQLFVAMGGGWWNVGMLDSPPGR